MIADSKTHAQGAVLSKFKALWARLPEAPESEQDTARGRANVPTYVIHLSGNVNPFIIFMPFQAGFTAGPVAGRRTTAVVSGGVDWAVAVAYSCLHSFGGSAMILPSVMV